MIRTTRKLLTALLFEFENKVKMTDDLLATLFTEIENIINSRPLTTVTSDHGDQVALTPNDILRLHSRNVFPVGPSNSTGGYIGRKWRQAQFLADVFWRRYKREYLSNLQQRQKWTKQQPQMSLGNIVFVVDNSAPRNSWNVGRINKVHYSLDNKVRSADVLIIKNKYLGSEKSVLTRPINKLILLMSVEASAVK